jgi:hypothetical protein
MDRKQLRGDTLMVYGGRCTATAEVATYQAAMGRDTLVTRQCERYTAAERPSKRQKTFDPHHPHQHPHACSRAVDRTPFGPPTCTCKPGRLLDRPSQGTYFTSLYALLRGGARGNSPQLLRRGSPFDVPVAPLEQVQTQSTAYVSSFSYLLGYIVFAVDLNGNLKTRNRTNLTKKSQADQFPDWRSFESESQTF